VWRAHSDDKTAIERKTSENNNLAKIITEEILKNLDKCSCKYIVYTCLMKAPNISSTVMITQGNIMPIFSCKHL
jgi:hypothetical protein